MMKTRQMPRRAITLVVTALGLALLIGSIHTTGLATILDGVRRMGVVGIMLILGASFLRQLARGGAWIITMRDEVQVPVANVFAATLAGDAMGNLTPFALLVSEPTKAMLVGHHLPVERALAALAAENFFYALSVIAAVLTGVTVMFVVFPVPDWLRVTSLVLVGGMTTALVLLLWLVAKRPSVLSGTLSRFGLKRPRVLDKIRALESSSYHFVRAHPAKLAGIVCCEVTFHLASIGETWITLYYLTGGLGAAGAAGSAGLAASPSALTIHPLALAIVLDTVQRVINVVFRVVPLKVGVDEVGSGLMTSALGLGPALGVTMGVVRKIRVLVWSAAGLLVLATRTSRQHRGTE